MKTRPQVGFWLVRRHPRAAARVGWKLAQHPRRTAMAIRLAQAAPDLTRRAQAAAADPAVKKQLRLGGASLVAAGARLRASEGDVSVVVADDRMWEELRRAARAMAAGYALAQAPPRRRRRAGRVVLTIGVIGAGAYAGFRATRGRDDQSPPAGPSG